MDHVIFCKKVNISQKMKLIIETKFTGEVLDCPIGLFILKMT